jgi:hypothetical protein
MGRGGGGKIVSFMGRGGGGMKVSFMGEWRSRNP